MFTRHEVPHAVRGTLISSDEHTHTCACERVEGEQASLIESRGICTGMQSNLSAAVTRPPKLRAFWEMHSHEIWSICVIVCMNAAVVISLLQFKASVTSFFRSRCQLLSSSHQVER